MTNKDLNLSLNHPFIQRDSEMQSDRPEKLADQNTVPGRENKFATETFPDTNSNLDPSASKLKTAPKTKRLTIKWSMATAALLFVVTINLLFLVMAGGWLVDRIPPQIEDIQRLPPPAPFENAEKLEAHLESLQHHIARLQVTIELIKEQQATSSLNIQQQYQTILLAMQTIEKMPVKKTTEWFVNLGTFSQPDSAKKLQQQIKAFAYPTEITKVTLNNKTAYRVRITGFIDRETAENAANRLMEITDLNGLWVWKGE